MFVPALTMSKFVSNFSLWNTGGTPEKYSNGTLTNFHLGVKSLWRGGLAKNLLQDFNFDQKGWANKVLKYYYLKDSFDTFKKLCL